MREVLSGFRQFHKEPGFAIAVGLTLALGIGANTAIFTLVHAVLLRSLPVQDPERLYRLGDQTYGGLASGFPDPTGSGDFSMFSFDLYEHLRKSLPDLRQMAAMQSGNESMNVRRGNDPARTQLTEYVSGNYFEVLGVGALAGRALTSLDDSPSAAPVAVISYAGWQADYAGETKIIGKTLTFQNHPVTIVGIAPADFYGDRLAARPPEFWLPLSSEPVIEETLSVLKKSDANWLNLIARLPRNSQLGSLSTQSSIEVQNWLKTVSTYQENGGAALIPRQHVEITAADGGIQNLQNQKSKGFYLLMTICLLVLLVACANVANLLLARSSAQRPEVALRVALGAPRTRILRQRMTESLILAGAGGVAGLAVAYGGARMILSLAFPDSPQLPINPNPSLPVIGFALLLSLLTGIVFGIVPAWITSHTDPAEALRGINRSTNDRASTPQRFLVAFQAVLSLVLLVAAGMFTKSLNNLQHQDLGFQTDNRYIVHFDAQGAGYGSATLPTLYDALLHRFGSMRGVSEAGLALYSPLEQDSWASDVYIGGVSGPEAGKHNVIAWDRVSPDYFKAVGQTLVRGRSFTEEDTATSQRVAIVSQSFAEKHFSGESAIGRRFGTGTPEHANDYEIVGVVGDAKYNNPAEPAPEMYFLPLKQVFRKAAEQTTDVDHSSFVNALVLHFATPSQNVDPVVRRVFADINPNLPVGNLETFSYQVSANFNDNLLLSRLAIGFATLAVVLASVGLYGITSYQVNRRTNEIGIRMALGATRGNVTKMVLKQALRQVAFGMIIGIPLAILGEHLIASQFYGIRSYDPLSFLLAIATLVCSATFAAVIPARRAASINPMRSLRNE
jgi:predicted permease